MREVPFELKAQKQETLKWLFQILGTRYSHRRKSKYVFFYFNFHFTNYKAVFTFYYAKYSIFSVFCKVENKAKNRIFCELSVKNKLFHIFFPQLVTIKSNNFKFDVIKLTCFAFCRHWRAFCVAKCSQMRQNHYCFLQAKSTAHHLLQSNICACKVICNL